MRSHVVVLALAGSLVATAGCGSTGGGTATPPGGAPATTAPAAAAKHFNAEQVTKALKARGLPVAGIIVYDENTDPNKRLGRPGQYMSKINFTDTRAKRGQASGGKDVADGGSVEVFDNASDAMTRGVYIETVTQGMQILGSEYDYIAGGVLLRLSGNLVPSAARKYANALNSIVGQPIVTPKPAHT
jgi:hypothetical protein